MARNCCSRSSMKAAAAAPLRSACASPSKSHFGAALRAPLKSKAQSNLSSGGRRPQSSLRRSSFRR
eukprot:3266565-Pyramimonas_sp.AAC.1